MTRKRKSHIGKCSPDFKYNNIPYDGNYVPWCLGGWGYILSRKSIGLLKDDNNYKDEIYEDLYVAKVLRRKKIFPILFRNIKNFFISPEHN